MIVESFDGLSTEILHDLCVRSSAGRPCCRLAARQRAEFSPTTAAPARPRRPGGQRGVGDVDRVGAGVGEVALPRVFVEEPRLRGQDLAASARRHCRSVSSRCTCTDADLTHPVAAGDRLVLDRRLDLRLADDDDRRRLDVEPDATGLDLADQHGDARRGGELVDQRLPATGVTLPVSGPNSESRRWPRRGSPARCRARHGSRRR